MIAPVGVQIAGEPKGGFALPRDTLTPFRESIGYAMLVDHAMLPMLVSKLDVQLQE